MSCNPHIRLQQELDSEIAKYDKLITERNALNRKISSRAERILLLQAEMDRIKLLN